MKIEKRYLSLPLTAQFEITDLCNHRCIHCYNLDSEVKNRPNRKVEDETVLACAQKLIDNNIFGIVITGGEPMLKKELTKKIIRLFRDNKIRVSLNSNLTLLDDDLITFLKEQKVSVLTSCPSGNSLSYKNLVGADNFAYFETNIKKLVVSGVKFSVNMVITKDNLQEIIPTAEKMKSLGCNSFAATPMGLNVEYPRLDLLLSVDEVRQVISDLLWIETNLKLKVDILEALPKCVFPKHVLSEKHSFLNRKCQAGRTVIAVSCNGDVRPCAHNPYSYGNILKEDLRAIWQKMKAWRSAQYIPSDCQNCSWLKHCNGGCRTSAKVYNGDWNKNDMWCVGALRTLPPNIHSQKKELAPNTHLQINSYLKARKEDEEAYVIYNVEDDISFMVSPDLYDFIMNLTKHTDLSFGDLCREFHLPAADDNMKNLVLFLIVKKIIKTTN